MLRIVLLEPSVNFSVKMQGAYQQAPTTVVVVQQPNTWYRGPNYLRSGVRVCGFALSLPLIICLGFSGAMFFFIGATTISMGKSHDSLFDDDDDDDVNPTVVVGTIMIIIGVVCTAGCIGLACYSKKQYQKLNHGLNDPGRVINRNPSPVPPQQPVMNPGQPGVFLPTSAGVYGPQPMGGYPAGYPPAAGGPMAYPPPGGQAYVYPPPTSAPYGAGPPYQQATVEKAAPPPYSPVDPGAQAAGSSPDPTLPCAPEYNAPPPYAPDYKAPI